MLIENKFRLGAVVVLAIMLFTALVPSQVASWEQTTRNALISSQNKELALFRLLSLMQDAESGKRGFIITGRETFLVPYYAAVVEVGTVKAELLRQQEGSNKDWQPIIDDIYQVVDLKLAEMASTIELRRTQGFAAVEAALSSGLGKSYMDRLRTQIDEQITYEKAHREWLQRELGRKIDVASYVSLGISTLNLALLGALLALMIQLLKRQRKTSEALQRASDKLEDGIAEAERHNTELALTAQMFHALESTVSVKEAFSVISIYSAKLLPGTSGIYYLFRNSRDLLEVAAQWGEPQHVQEVIEPLTCWGLRRGQVHYAQGSRDLCCTHYPNAEQDADAHLCIPLMAQGEVLGLLYLQIPVAQGKKGSSQQQALAVAISEQISLALTNAKLREVLKQQSIIDPLTGLFNRRYLDETLRRELSRAQRKGAPLSLIVLDLDHFKRINDTLGHDAGDFVLSSIAAQIKKDIREGDLACRFGGEELVVILPECDWQAAYERAEKIRANIHALSLRQGSRDLDQVSASFGVATFPYHGNNPDTLFQAADRALYKAKHSGRNCVVVADGGAATSQDDSVNTMDSVV